MQENSLQSQVPKTYLPFHLHTFWDSFYKNHIQQQDSSNINWYFDLTTFSTPEFSLKKFSKEDEILLVGAGLSSTLDYFDSNGFDNITIFDFSEELANILKNKYVIIDKGCLDCILSDPKDGENKFITALTNLALWLDENNGVLYYFSNGKMEDRSQLFFKTDKIKYKGYMIDMNETMKEEYKEFNKSDNVYYLYIITRAQ